MTHSHQSPELAAPREIADTLKSLLTLRLFVLGAMSIGGLIWWWFSDYVFSWYFITAFVVLIFWTTRRLRQDLEGKRPLIVELALDYIWVTGFVMSLGGAANPFIYYFLLLTAISALSLSSRLAWMFCASGIAIYSAILIAGLGQHLHHTTQDYRLHLLGMWVNFLLSALLSCFFITRLSERRRAQNTLITQLRENTLKNEHLVGLGTIAASTIHALGTPLSTLKILAGEMKNNRELDQQAREDAATMLSQIDRCAATMKSLSRMVEPDTASDSEPVNMLIDAVKEHFALLHPEFKNAFETTSCFEGLTIRGGPLLHHALINLIHNAFQADQYRSAVRVSLRAQKLVMHIVNDFDGEEGALLRHWGEAHPSAKTGGLGIGTLLANSTIERLGGTVSLQIENNTPRNTAHIVVELPLEANSL